MCNSLSLQKNAKLATQRAGLNLQQVISHYPHLFSTKNVRRDCVDEEYQRLGIFYKCWVPLNQQQTSHPSVCDFNDDTVIPDEQNIPEWCIMCHPNTYLKNENVGHHHYLSRHHSCRERFQTLQLQLLRSEVTWVRQ